MEGGSYVVDGGSRVNKFGQVYVLGGGGMESCIMGSGHMGTTPSCGQTARQMWLKTVPSRKLRMQAIKS